MKSMRLALLATVLMAGSAPGAQQPGLCGVYKLCVFGGIFDQSSIALIQFQLKEGKLEGIPVAVSRTFRGLQIKNVNLTGDKLQIMFDLSSTHSAFEGAICSDAVRGTYWNDHNASPAILTQTQLHNLEGVSDESYPHIPECKEARELIAKMEHAYRNASQQKEPQARARALEAAKKVVDGDRCKLFRNILHKYPDSPVVFGTAYVLLRNSNDNPTVEEGRAWSATLTKAARPYGPRLEAFTAVRLAELLLLKEGLEALALDQARRAESFLNDKSSIDDQIRVLRVLTTSLKKTGGGPESKLLEAKLAKLDTLLDEEYLAKMPPFQSPPFTGRKSKNIRAVVLELFTGADCVPCVAADMGFDGLLKSYKPTEVILLQYHLHMAGPNPLCNADAQARVGYYEVRGTPSTFFNGSPLAGGGGPVDRSERKYQEYRKLIDPLLEEAPEATINLSATRHGNKVDIKAQVSDLAGPGGEIKLRFVLVEETVHYVGRNRIRYHHQIVRAMPGGAEGVALKEKSSQHAISVDLDELRRKLNKHLDEFAKEHPFSNPDRPMEFKKLHVVALVQDDDSGEILQAAQVPVPGKEGVVSRQ